jgi:hypothetical protein
MRFSTFDPAPDLVPGGSNGIGNGFGYVDVSGDNSIDPLDALQVIGELRRRQAAMGGEGESAAVGGGGAEGEGGPIVVSASSPPSAEPSMASAPAPVAASPTAFPLIFTEIAAPPAANSPVKTTATPVASNAPASYGNSQDPIGLPGAFDDFTMEYLDPPAASDHEYTDAALESVLADIADDISNVWSEEQESIDAQT